MKYIITLAVLLISASLADAQFQHDSFSLIAQDKPLHMKRVPFNKVVVWDNRFDTVSFRMDESNPRGPRMDCFSKPASEEVKNFIENSIVFFPAEKRTVYINVKQLRIGNLGYLSHKLFFAADAYISKNEKLEKIYSVNKEYSVIHSYKHAITKALNKFIVGLCNNYYVRHDIDTSTYTISDINVNERNQWASYPIIKENKIVNGIYKTFDDFRNNRIDSCVDFNLQIWDDSTSHIFFPGKSDYYDTDAGALKNIFAISFSDELYIPVSGQGFMPLYKTNNSFYFYVPASLPDAYTIIYNQRFINYQTAGNLDLSGVYIGGHPHGSGNVHSGNSGNRASDWKAALILAGAVVGIAVTVAIIKAVKKKHPQASQQSQMGDIRNCFLDMDTGDIIYY